MVAKDPNHFWCGGYTASMDGGALGIGSLRVGSGESGPEFLGTVVEASSPSFLLRRGNTLYAVDEANAGVNAFRLSGGSLLPLGSQRGSGSLPCHLSAHNGWLYVSNYGSGTLDVYPLLPGGEIGEVAATLEGHGSGPHEAQDAPHAHSTLVVGETVLSADLGADRVYVHRWVDGRFVRLSAIELPAGTGPRDLALVDGRVLVLGELSQRVLELENGVVVRSGSIVATPSNGDHAAALLPDARGRFLYTTLRGSNRIAVVDCRTLEPVFDISSGGDWPRHLAFSGDRLLVANQLSNTVSRFLVDAETGILSADGIPQSVPSPTFLLAGNAPDLAERESLVK